MECGNQETQRREGVSNGVREDAEVRRGEKAGMGWTVIIQMGKRPRDGTKTTSRTRVRAKERGQLDMVREKWKEKGQLDMIREEWKERLKWTKTQEKDPARGW